MSALWYLICCEIVYADVWHELMSREQAWFDPGFMEEVADVRDFGHK